MKAISIRPFKRHMLIVLSLSMFTGCSGIQSSAVYKNWEERAYRAYKVSVPARTSSIVPALFRSVSTPGQLQMGQPKRYNVAHPKIVAPVKRPPASELKYIEQHYGI